MCLASDLFDDNENIILIINALDYSFAAPAHFQVYINFQCISLTCNVIVSAVYILLLERETYVVFLRFHTWFILISVI